jgi:hypothetical protein
MDERNQTFHQNAKGDGEGQEALECAHRLHGLIRKKQARGQDVQRKIRDDQMSLHKSRPA